MTDMDKKQMDLHQKVTGTEQHLKTMDPITGPDLEGAKEAGVWLKEFLEGKGVPINLSDIPPTIIEQPADTKPSPEGGAFLVEDSVRIPVPV